MDPIKVRTRRASDGIGKFWVFTWDDKPLGWIQSLPKGKWDAFEPEGFLVISGSKAEAVAGLINESQWVDLVRSVRIIGQGSKKPRSSIGTVGAMPPLGVEYDGPESLAELIASNLDD